MTLSLAYQDANIMGAGGLIQPMWAQQKPAWFPEEFNWVVGCSYRGLPENTAPVRNLIGCNMSYLRIVIEQLGGFRNGIGHVGGRPQGDDEQGKVCDDVWQRGAQDVASLDGA